MHKKNRKSIKIRRTWNVSPVTRVKKSKKLYCRKGRFKHDPNT